MHPLLRAGHSRGVARTGEAAPLSPTTTVIATVAMFAGLALLVTRMGVTHGTPRFRDEDP